VPSLNVPAYCPDEKRASRKYSDLSKGVLKDTTARRMVATRQRSVPGVAERVRKPIFDLLNYWEAVQ
jgi:hypothetical protein